MADRKAEIVEAMEELVNKARALVVEHREILEFSLLFKTDRSSLTLFARLTLAPRVRWRAA
jgi:hypothetical protein